MPTLIERIRKGWNAFINNRDPTDYSIHYGTTSYLRPDRARALRGSERTILSSVYNRIANDVAAIDIFHVRTDENGHFVEVIDDELNKRLSVDANIDQTGRGFIKDFVESMLIEGVAVAVPVECNVDPYTDGSAEILELRTGKVVQWNPYTIKVDLYNSTTGRREEITVPKELVAIVENPFYSVMNEPNSTYQRLVRKLNLLDVVDEQSSAGKLDLIIGLPYLVKSEARKKQAEERRQNIIDQLTDSKYGIAYTDSTEHITQLNRPIENNLMEQIEYLTKMLYSQLGIPEDVFNGSANEQVMLNYNNTILEPILTAITEEFERKFLTKTARTQRQSIMYFRNPFKLVPTDKAADIFDRFTRNEIISSNEARGFLGMKPAMGERADELLNKNVSQSDIDYVPPATTAPDGEVPQEEYVEEQPIEEQQQPVVEESQQEPVQEQPAPAADGLTDEQLIDLGLEYLELLKNQNGSS